MTNQNTSAPPRDYGGNDHVFDGKSVLVTGGTGSFGRMFVRQVLDHADANRVIVFSRDELKQYEMAQELSGHPRFKALRFFIGDVRDVDRMEMAFCGVDYVIHAAALKQVPTAEYNPFECIRTNVMGAENVVRAAIACGVSRVVALSTDKAASPINLYGASKLASDKIFFAANHMAATSASRFAVVRYGNVIGSRGSVVPLFERLIAWGDAALPITDPRMKRFWITLAQGVRFVISSLQMMQGGEIFVPKISSMRMVDLARAMAPNRGIEIIGIRSGEKLHEVMITEDDARNTLELPDRYVMRPQLSFWTDERYLAMGAKAVAEDFRYASDNNPEWLDADGLARMLKISKE